MLVHDLQNHDEITYQLVELDHRKDEFFTVGAARLTGMQLRERMLQEMRAKAAGPGAPYNKLYRPARDGIATTFAGFIAPALGVRDPYNATAAEIRRICRGHLLLAAANALQPGVFSLSSWDLVGALPVPEEKVRRWIQDDDYRWVNRGGVDLLGANPGATESAFGLPRGNELYGPLPQQLKQPESFAWQLKRLLAARRRARIAESELIAVPEPNNSGLCLLVLRLPDRSPAITVLNFGRKDADEGLDLKSVGKGTGNDQRAHEWIDIRTGRKVGPANGAGRLRLQVPALSGTTFVLGRKSR
jgi:maltose alpha-D-glucosyltransferase/alpha-amylase